jgi:hypothetical protein
MLAQKPHHCNPSGEEKNVSSLYRDDCLEKAIPAFLPWLQEKDFLCPLFFSILQA